MHLDNSACNLASHEPAHVPRRATTSSTSRASRRRWRWCSPARRSSSATPTTRPRRSPRRRGPSASWASATPTWARCSWPQGLPYDSDAGRAWAAAITALLTGHAYATSARTAARMGPFAGYHENAEPMLNVLRMHQAEAARIDEDVVPPELLSAAQEAWDQAVELAEEYGVRNSQASRAGPDGHHRAAHGLRHHRRRARPRAGQDEEARGRRHDVDRQPDGAPCADQARLHADAGRGHRRLHQRAHVDRRRAAPGARAPARVRLLHGRQHDPLLRATSA